MHINPFCTNYARHSYASIFRSKAEKGYFVIIHLIVSDPLVLLYFIINKKTCFPIVSSRVPIFKTVLIFFPKLSY